MKPRTLSMCLGLCLGLAAGTGLLTGCASDQYDRSAGRYLDDQVLVANVNNALDTHPEYKFSGVHVDAFQGVIQLSGFVNSEDQKAEACRVAQEVKGVKAVENKISVRPTFSSTP